MKSVARFGVCVVILALSVGQVFGADDKKKKKGAEGAPSADGMSVYKDAKHGFRIKYPSDWAAMATPGADPVVTFSHKAANGQVTENIGVSLEHAKNVKRSDDNLDVILAELEVQFRKQFTDVKIVSEKPVDVAGFPGRSLVFTGNRQGVTIEMQAAFTVARGQFYMVSAATTPDRYESVAPTFRSVIASFELTQPGKKK